MYHSMNQNRMVKTLTVLNELSQKFPMMAFSHINLNELAKFYKLEGKDFLVMRAFLDSMRKMNEDPHKTTSFFIDLNHVMKINVRKKNDTWIFHVYKNSNEKMKIVHVFPQ